MLAAQDLGAPQLLQGAQHASLTAQASIKGSWDQDYYRLQAPGWLRQDPGQRHPLGLAAGEVRDGAVDHPCHAQPVENRLCLPALADRVADGALRERRFLVQNADADPADVACERGCIVRDRLGRAGGVGRVGAGQDLQRDGCVAAVGFPGGEFGAETVKHFTSIASLATKRAVHVSSS